MANYDREAGSPFPGMDPYLKHPHLWPDVHNRLITMIAIALMPQLRSRCYAAIDERVYLAAPKRDLVGRSDVSLVGSKDKGVWPRVDETATPYHLFLIDLPTFALDEVREIYLEVREVAGVAW